VQFVADASSFEGGEFELFGEPHLIALTLVVLAQVLLAKTMKDASPVARGRVRVGLAAGLVAQEVSYHAWRLATGTWTAREMVPLHLCSVAVWFGAAMLALRNQTLYDHLYYVATFGATIALLTPDIGRFGFPHYRFFQFFVSHGLVLGAPWWMTFVEGFRPSRGSLLKAMAGTVVHGAGAYLVNRRLGSNYLFVSRKPATSSVLDKLPDWPGYLPYVAAAVFAAYGALALPWALKDAQG